MSDQSPSIQIDGHFEIYLRILTTFFAVDSFLFAETLTRLKYGAGAIPEYLQLQLRRGILAADKARAGAEDEFIYHRNRWWTTRMMLV